MVLALFFFASCTDYEALYSADTEYNSREYEYSYTDAYTEGHYGWDDQPAYTAHLPKPVFPLEDAFVVNELGVRILTFVSADKLSLADLTDYLQKLTDQGFTNEVSNTNPEEYSGTVYKNGTRLMEYTYKNQTVVLDLFKS